MGKQLIERIKYWSQLFLLPVYGLSFLFPRNKQIWLFGSSFGERFADNSRYFYLYIRQNHADKIHAVWISQDKEIINFLREQGYEAFYKNSLKGIWFELRAGVYIFDNYSKDISFWLSGKSIKINLWHGSGNKKTNYDNIFDSVRHPKNNYEKWKTFLRRISDEKPYHYTLATSEAMAKIFSSAFQTDRKHILLGGYPRNDMLFPIAESKITNIVTEPEALLLQQLQRLKEANYILSAYMPTFRDSEQIFFEVMDLETFNQYLEDRKLIFITKLHPKSKLKKKFEEIKYSNIINADAVIDIYSFLKLIDILITDYSSVYTDYMLLNRPVVAFHFDWQQYTANTRDCYIPQDEYMPEVKAVNMQELMEAIDYVLHEDKCSSKRMQSRKRMFGVIDGRSSERLFDKIVKLTEKRIV